MKNRIKTIEPRAKRTYKDTLFRMLFQEKENLLSLYNAVNGTNYKNTDELTVTTLENAIYMNYKNDISFIFNFELMLYEHQSTINPNMPLRHLIYITKELQGITRNDDLYSKALISIPTPKFVVFYNGADFQPERQILKLSDSYQHAMESPELELLVTVYNINLGCNQPIMEACKLLKEYAQYVNQVREFAKTMPFPQAVGQAVDFCIQNGILSDFLLKNKSEAIEMSIFEYDEEKHLKNEREISYNDGKKAGLKEGIRIFISDHHADGLSQEKILQKLQNCYSLTEKQALEYYREAILSHRQT